VPGHESPQAKRENRRVRWFSNAQRIASDDAIAHRRLDDDEVKDAVCLASGCRGPTSPKLGDPPLDLAVSDRPNCMAGPARLDPLLIAKLHAEVT